MYQPLRIPIQSRLEENRVVVMNEYSSMLSGFCAPLHAGNTSRAVQIVPDLFQHWGDSCRLSKILHCLAKSLRSRARFAIEECFINDILRSIREVNLFLEKNSCIFPPVRQYYRNRFCYRCYACINVQLAFYLAFSSCGSGNVASFLHL